MQTATEMGASARWLCSHWDLESQENILMDLSFRLLISNSLVVNRFQSVHAAPEELMDKVVLSKKLFGSINAEVFTEYCI